MKWFLNWVERIGRKRIVMDRINEEPYLERYYLFLKDRKRFPFNVFLHHFLKSDPDDVHDHPWNYTTVIVKGGYWEWIPQFNNQGQKIGELARWRGVGHIRRCRAESYHRIELDPSVDCWTIFIPGVQKREWGFLTRNGRENTWVQHEDYLTNWVRR
jgi:hypothetical protein